MTVPQKTPPAGDIMEAVIAQGDIAKLTPEQRVEYYLRVCKSIGLNPATRPFEYVTLNGKLQLYARRDCADQLRKINGISLTIVSQDQADGLLTVHVRAKDRDGREDEDLGVVPFPDTLKGEFRSNQILKCVTKAKRRVTLSISGLGFLDETEVDSIPDVRKPKPPAKNVMVETVDPFTGEITEPPPGAAPEAADDAPPPSEPPLRDGGGASLSPPASVASYQEQMDKSRERIERIERGRAAVPMRETLSIEDMAREAAMRGEKVFRQFYRLRSGAEQMQINKIGDELRGLMEENK